MTYSRGELNGHAHQVVTLAKLHQTLSSEKRLLSPLDTEATSDSLLTRYIAGLFIFGRRLRRHHEVGHLAQLVRTKHPQPVLHLLSAGSVSGWSGFVWPVGKLEPNGHF